jgi:WD40 repeat protein
LTTSSDATAIVWDITEDKGLNVQCVLTGHAGPITAATGLQYQTNDNKSEIIIATTSVDFNIKIWKHKATDSKGKYLYVSQTEV